MQAKAVRDLTDKGPCRAIFRAFAYLWEMLRTEGSGVKIGVWLRALAESVLRRKRLVELEETVAGHLNVLPAASAQLREANRQVESGVTHGR